MNVMTGGNCFFIGTRLIVGCGSQKIPFYMFLEGIEIENFRSFKELDLKLSKSINVIAGSNNAGKSTILKAIYLLQDAEKL